MFGQTYSRLPSQQEIDSALAWLLGEEEVVYIVQHGSFDIVEAEAPDGVEWALVVLYFCDPAELPEGLSFESDYTHDSGVIGVVRYEPKEVG